MQQKKYLAINFQPEEVDEIKQLAVRLKHMHNVPVFNRSAVMYAVREVNKRLDGLGMDKKK